MHRSGTSVLARALQALGVELGSELISGDRSNEAGYWEDADINRFNDALLSHLGTHWTSVARVQPDLFDRRSVRPFHRRAVALLSRKLARASNFGFKDPRTSILLPFWKSVFRDLGLQGR